MTNTLETNDRKSTLIKNRKYTYQETLAAAQKINWRIEDIIGGDKKLNYTMPFMPESLARVERMTFLTPDERRTLNQIRGHAYLCVFGLVEEFILPFVMDHARPQLQGDDYRVRALLQFAGEEAKHIHLFKRFREEFQRDFGVQCAVIGPPDEIAKAILSHDPLAVALTILHIEWMTQRHYQDSVQGDQRLDPQFKSLLRHHWMEEAQHAKLDTLMVEALAEGRGAREIESAVVEYIDIGGFLDGGLRMQTQFDMESFMRASGRRLTDGEREEFMQVQHQANRWTYLGTGMTHPNFLATLENLMPEMRKRVEQIAPAFC